MKAFSIFPLFAASCLLAASSHAQEKERKYPAVDLASDFVVDAKWPQRPDGIELGIYNADSLPWALITSLLALPLSVITVYVLRVMARFHASLVVELLGRR